MSRGPQNWIVIKNGQRVSLRCTTTHANLHFPTPAMQELLRFAKQDGSTLAAVVRLAVLDYVQKRQQEEG